MGDDLLDRPVAANTGRVPVRISQPVSRVKNGQIAVFKDIEDVHGVLSLPRYGEKNTTICRCDALEVRRT